MSLNHIVIMGRISKDLHLKTLPSGTEVLNFSVAVPKAYKKNAEEEKPDFFDVVAFGQMAGFVERNFRKGQMIAVGGRMESESYTDKNGNNRTGWKIKASSIDFAGDKKTDHVAESGEEPKATSGNFFDEVEDGSEEDLPF